MSLKRRLDALEARLRAAEDVEQIGFYEADVQAGVWRDTLTGETRPMSPAELEGAREHAENGAGLLLLGPLPGAPKIIWGVDGDAL